MSTVSLYERTEALQIVDELLVESEGELTPEIEALLAEAQGDFREKAERVALKIKEIEATSAAIEAETDRLAARAHARLNAAKSLKAYLKAQMEITGQTKVEGLLCTVALQKNPAALQLTVGADGLPETYVRTIPATVEPDKKAILDALKAGIEIPGASLTQGTHLRIR